MLVPTTISIIYGHNVIYETSHGCELFEDDPISAYMINVNNFSFQRQLFFPFFIFSIVLL